MNKHKLIYPGKKVAVMGLGVSGRAAVRYALLRGGLVSISDLRPQKQLLEEERDVLGAGQFEVEGGEHTYSFLSKADIVIVSPGIDLNIPLIVRLRKNGVTIVGELAFAADELAVPCIAITGTNGKTTVTTLVGELLRAAGKKVFVGGNIGTSLFDYFCNPDNVDCVVLEVSSFQLESAGSFSPDIAVLLNITADHLDRHGSMAEYIRAKWKIFQHQGSEDLAILCADDSASKRMAGEITAKVQWFGKNCNCDATISGAGSKTHVVAEQTYPLKGTALEGALGGLNFAAAILAAKGLGCPAQAILEGLTGFSSLVHRLQYVKDVDGVGYYNDSKATNTGALIGALAQFDCKVVLIAGGRDKGDDYRLLRKSIRERVRRLIVIGEAASLFAKALSDVVDIAYADSMTTAVKIACESAVRGEAVLLSPACASFDMFASYGHRGEAFVNAVEALGESDAKVMEPLH